MMGIGLPVWDMTHIFFRNMTTIWRNKKKPYRTLGEKMVLKNVLSTMTLCMLETFPIS